MVLTEFEKTNIHNHTVFSDGQSTITDYVRYARACRVREFGISDHAINSLLPDSCIKEAADFEEYLGELELSGKRAGIRILKGLEVPQSSVCDLLNRFGDAVFRLDYLLVESFLVWTPRLIEIVSGIRETLGLNVVSLAHPTFNGSSDDIVQTLVQSGLCVELNSAHRTFTYRGQAEYFRKIILNGVPITFGSDAHSAERLDELEVLARFYDDVAAAVDDADDADDAALGGGGVATARSKSS